MTIARNRVTKMVPPCRKVDRVMLLFSRGS